jgi:SpoVK/Ycf46/Vps4 family AAA+-type ATPase
MAAQVIARELGMEMFVVNLSSLVSKYIGETEKNLESVFAEAAKSGGILFFDEADALFGKRGEQKDSHDKYANMQTAYLLQRFENYNGVVLLASNLASNLDRAFLRRIQIKIEFPPPDKSLRAMLWERSLTRSRAPVSEDIDIPFLAETFDITGAAIRNSVVAAAFIAASETGIIGMRELIQALSMEFAKQDKVLTEKELREFVFLP